MGFSGIARWINAPPDGTTFIYRNIQAEHGARLHGDWVLKLQSFRSDLASFPGSQVLAERSMCTLTMHNNVFVSLEDPAAVQRPSVAEAPTSSHYRSTFVTITPPDALEALISQLRARWTKTRPTARREAGAQVTIQGKIFTIGTDWIIRVGSVNLTGGNAQKGVILEAEYLPLPALQSQTPDGTTTFVSNMLLSIIPGLQDARTEAVSMSDAQWEDVLREDEEGVKISVEGDPPEMVVDDDIFVAEDDDVGSIKKGDWIGVDRDRRSAFLIMDSPVVHISAPINYQQGLTAVTKSIRSLRSDRISVHKMTHLFRTYLVYLIMYYPIIKRIQDRETPAYGHRKLLASLVLLWMCTFGLLVSLGCQVLDRQEIMLPWKFLDDKHASRSCATWETVTPSNRFLYATRAVTELDLGAKFVWLSSQGNSATYSGQLNIQVKEGLEKARVQVLAEYNDKPPLNACAVKTVSSSGLDLSVAPVYDRRRVSKVYFTVDLQVPVNQSIDGLGIGVFNFDVNVLGLEAYSATIHTVNGNIVAESMNTQQAKLRTTNGSIRGSFLGSVDFHSINGPIHATVDRATWITARASNAPITGLYKTLGDAEIVTVNGKVDVNVELTATRSLRTHKLTIKTLNAPLMANITLSSASIPRPRYNIVTSTDNSPLTVNVSQPLGSMLDLKAATTMGPLDVSLGKAYTGSFELASATWFKHPDLVQVQKGDRNITLVNVSSSELRGQVDNQGGHVSLKNESGQIKLVLHAM